MKGYINYHHKDTSNSLQQGRQIDFFGKIHMFIHVNGKTGY